MPASTSALVDYRTISHLHLFCGLGGGARGFSRGTAGVGNMQAIFRCLGGIDVDPAAIKDFERLAGVPGTVLDLFDREQYTAFHGRSPGAGWREATPQDIQRAAGYKRPNIIFLSAPCKGFSGLLSESRSLTDKYQALNHLTLRGMMLALTAFEDDPPELILFENVPRISSRGRSLLDRIGALLRHHGYAVAETSHDCGELGGLAQSRKRFLLVARHQIKVPPFLYEPPKRPLRAVGDVLGRMLLPGDLRAGPIHRVPSLQWRTWIRLAFIEAGGDWRSLARLRVTDGQLADFGLVRQNDWHSGILGVNRWNDPTGTITGNARPGTGAFSVADPRRQDGTADYGQYGVKTWQQTSQTITGKAAVGAGHFAVADPRHAGPPKFNNIYRVVQWTEESPAVTSSPEVAVADPRPQGDMFHNAFKTVDWTSPSHAITSQHAPSNGAMCVADPRTFWPDHTHQSKLRVHHFDAPTGTITGSDRVGSGALCVADPRMQERRAGAIGVIDWADSSGTVAGESLPSNGAFAVADPRAGLTRTSGDAYLTAGHYGVVPWSETAGAIAAAGQHDNGRWSVADPRPPAATDRLVAIIQSLDGTWHRPFTTLELAALQSLVDPEEHLELDGASDAGWRERIGNSVPPDAATAIANTMAKTLLLAWSGESFMLSSVPIWVRQTAIGLSVQQPQYSPND